jgi:rhodanese-related sulfurtransferase
VTYCNKGVTGNAAQNVLLNRGFRKVYNLSGGFNQFTKYKKSKEMKSVDKQGDRTF